MCFKINIILLHISKVSSQIGFLFIFLEDCVLFGLNIHIIKPKYELNFHFFMWFIDTVFDLWLCINKPNYSISPLCRNFTKHM